MNPDPVLRIPAREIPLPSGVSPQARAQLSQAGPANPPWPAVGDTPAWRAVVETMDETGLAGLGMMAARIDAEVEETEVDGVRVFVATPRDLPADDSAIHVDVHGGALMWGGGPSCRAMGVITAAMVRRRVWAVDYRLPPDHPYPAGLDDCVTVYRALLRDHDPAAITLGGASAGGNLAPATVLRARDEGLPLPAALLLLTPELDLTESGDTFSALLGVDTALTSRLMPANLTYAGAHPLDDPYVSPLFGDFGAGFPPTYLQSGTRDLFLSNTVRMHRALRAAGVPADLHVYEGATHVGFAVGPEADDRDREIRAFLDTHCPRSKVSP